jgi:hypothetical protein
MRFEHPAQPGDDAGITATVVISLTCPGYDLDPRTRGRVSARGLMASRRCCLVRCPRTFAGWTRGGQLI